MRGMNKTNSPTNKRLLLVAVSILVALIIWGLFYYFLQKPSHDVSQNYAKEVAAGMEQALLKEGATKVCEGGDDGRGWDNKSPWYKGFLTIDAGHEQAAATIKEIATQNGYSLSQGSVSNRGPLGVDDKFINNWYFDNTSKQNPYNDLSPGLVTLLVHVNADGADKACGSDTPITIDDTHSVIGLEVELPEFKR